MRGRPRPTPIAVVPFLCHQLAVPAQQGVWCDQRVQPVQRFATERVRFSGESSTFGVSEANAASAQALLEQAVLFLEVVDQIQLMTVDPSREHHQQQVKRLKQRGHCWRAYRLDRYCDSTSWRGDFGASSVKLDTTA